MYKGPSVWLMANLTSDTMEARGSGITYSKWQRKKSKPKKLSSQRSETQQNFRNEGKIKAFSDKQKLQNFFIRITEEILTCFQLKGNYTRW